MPPALRPRGGSGRRGAGLGSEPGAPIVDRLGAIRCPVLIVNGEHDVEDFLDAAETLERRLPDARRLRVADSGGFPMWERPDALNDAIRRHLEGRS